MGWVERKALDLLIAESGKSLAVRIADAPN